MKKSITAGLITFIAALAITTVIAIVYITTAAGNRRERAEFIAESVADRIEAEIQRRDYITRMLEIEVSSSKDGIAAWRRLFSNLSGAARNSECA